MTDIKPLNKERVDTIKNGVIRDSFLGYEDHNIFTVTVTVETSDGVQSTPPFSGFAERIIVGILKVSGAKEWRDVLRKPVRLAYRGTSIVAIGHFIEDKWFNFDDLDDEAYEEKKKGTVTT